MYRILFSRRSQKAFSDLPQEDAKRIRKALDALAENPRMPGTIKLTNAPVADYRFRVGNYRILFEIDDDNQQVLVYDIRRRTGQTYRP